MSNTDHNDQQRGRASLPSDVTARRSVFDRFASRVSEFVSKA